MLYSHPLPLYHYSPRHIFIDVYIGTIVTTPNANHTCTDLGVEIIICVLSQLFSQVLATAALRR
jgi:hypothetical protein